MNYIIRDFISIIIMVYIFNKLYNKYYRDKKLREYEENTKADNTYDDKDIIKYDYELNRQRISLSIVMAASQIVRFFTTNIILTTIIIVVIILLGEKIINKFYPSPL